MKRLLLLLVVLAAILGGAGVLYRHLFGDVEGGKQPIARQDAAVAVRPALPEDAGVAEDGAVTAAVLRGATIVDVRGKAQRRRADRRWAPVQSGELLTLDDTVRTLSGGSLQLKLGDSVQVRLTPRTEVTIRELTERAARVRLEEGRIVAEVNPQGKTVLRVEAKGSEAQAEARGGSFSMISDGRGQVAVATTAGSVNLVSAGKNVAVKQGQTARVVGDRAPTKPAPVPSSLYLKVAAPQRNIQRESVTTVTGRTTPGSLVRVAGRTARVNRLGNFRIKVPLEEGANELEVEVVDVTGREKKLKMNPITVDSREPEIQGSEVKWGGE